MKKGKFTKFLSFVLTFALIFSNFLGVGKGNVAFAGTGVETDPYTVTEAINYAQTTFATSSGTGETTIEGYIVGMYSSTSPAGIILADSSTQDVSSKDKTKILYVIPHASTQQNVDELNKWNITDKVGKKVKVIGPWRKKTSAAYGTEKVVTIGTVSGADIKISEAELPVNKVSPVTSNPPAGQVETGIPVILSCTTEGAKIYYTTDGTDPSTTSTEYTTPITINEAVTIKAIAVKEGMDNSDISTFSYTIKQASDLMTIADARTRAVNDTVKVKGIVTFVDAGSSDAAPYNVYIQDETAGIDICYYKNSISTVLNVGDIISVNGTIATYKDLLEIKPASAADVTVESSGNTLPTPKTITISEALGETYESQLVEIKDVILGTINTGANTSITDDTAKTINIYKIPALTDIKEGDRVNVKGVISQFTSYQLRVRQPQDITIAAVMPDTEPPAITHTPVTIGNIGEDLTITANVTDNKKVSSAKLYYRAKGAAEYKSLDMTLSTGAGNTYTAVIPKTEIVIAGLEYYIEATDGTNTVTSPADKNAPYSVTISSEDVVGPEITIISPKSGESTGNNLRPAISASYSDPAGINLATINLKIDDTDVTAKAVITETGIAYTPDTDLAKVEHKVTLTVTDNSAKKNISVMVWNFTVGEEALKCYFGQIHSHTAEGSDGTGTYDDAYSYARDHAKADFFALTDHSNWFDNELNYNLDGPKDASKPSTKWDNMHKTADQYNEDGKFVAIAGYEMTWSGSTGGWGHINTYNTTGFETRSNSKMDLKAYYADLAAHPQSISQLNHPGTTFGDFADFGYYTAAADAVVDLVEVGNGEGPVRGSGYFPSYQYYTRALDKGWHLAPTNNQDNHKGKWVDANTARDVILAPTLTRESIFDAIRKMRVYATEDENLKIDYKVNNKVMGSSLDNPSSLNISINVTDPDATDKVGKVSIIVNGGKVAAEKTFDTNTAAWDLTLSPEYTYYYVRIDEADKDIAVTAPVWTAEVVPVGISKVYSSQNVSVVNEPVDISAEVYNNGSTALSNVKVEFYKDEVKEENKIGEETLTAVAAASTATAKMAWTPNKAGDYTIYAKTVINVDGKDKVFTESTKVVAKNKEDIIKVVLDGAHANQYVTGNYAGKMLELNSLLTQKNCVVVQNTNPIDDNLLKDARLLILTDPQSTNDTKYNLIKSIYAASEIAAIKKFVENGGNLIITSKADYGDGTGEYNNAIQGNSVLEAIGSNLRFNDDEVVDNTTNGGQAYRLAFNKFTSSKYNLTDGIPEGETYSFYSGCSVLLKPQGDTSMVDYLVMGHDTTEALDSDNAGDNTAVTKGDICALAAEKLSSGAKIIVAGSTFFSDFETTGDNENANVPITKNILEWTASPKSGSLATIAEVRVDANKDGIPDNLGKRFTVEGIVTSQSEAVTPKNAFFEVIYVQDATGGITVFGVSKTPLPLGTKVRISGIVDEYQGDAEIQIENEDYDVEIIDSTPSVTEPKLMTTNDSMLEENEGWLLKVVGKVTKMDTQNIYVNDGTGEARIYVEGYIGDETGNEAAKGKWNSNIKVGDTISAVGLASEDPQGHRLRVRNTSEIVIKDYTYVKIEKITNVSEFKLGSTATISVSAENLCEGPQKATIIIALYDASTNRMVNFVAASQTIESLKKIILTGSLMLPATGNYKLRCFVWDDLSETGMHPLSDVIEIPVK